MIIKLFTRSDLSSDSSGQTSDFSEQSNIFPNSDININHYSMSKCFVEGAEIAGFEVSESFEIAELVKSVFKRMIFSVMKHDDLFFDDVRIKIAKYIEKLHLIASSDTF